MLQEHQDDISKQLAKAQEELDDLKTSLRETDVESDHLCFDESSDQYFLCLDESTFPSIDFTIAFVVNWQDKKMVYHTSVDHDNSKRFLEGPIEMFNVLISEIEKQMKP